MQTRAQRKKAQKTQLKQTKNRDLKNGQDFQIQDIKEPKVNKRKQTATEGRKETEKNINAHKKRKKYKNEAKTAPQTGRQQQKRRRNLNLKTNGENSKEKPINAKASAAAMAIAKWQQERKEDIAQLMAEAAGFTSGVRDAVARAIEKKQQQQKTKREFLERETSKTAGAAQPAVKDNPETQTSIAVKKRKEPKTAGEAKQHSSNSAVGEMQKSKMGRKALAGKTITSRKAAQTTGATADAAIEGHHVSNSQSEAARQREQEQRSPHDTRKCHVTFCSSHARDETQRTSGSNGNKRSSREIGKCSKVNGSQSAGGRSSQNAAAAACAERMAAKRSSKSNSEEAAACAARTEEAVTSGSSECNQDAADARTGREADKISSEGNRDAAAVQTTAKIGISGAKCHVTFCSNRDEATTSAAHAEEAATNGSPSNSRDAAGARAGRKAGKIGSEGNRGAAEVQTTARIGLGSNQDAAAAARKGNPVAKIRPESSLNAATDAGKVADARAGREAAKIGSEGNRDAAAVQTTAKIGPESNQDAAAARAGKAAAKINPESSQDEAVTCKEKPAAEVSPESSQNAAADAGKVKVRIGPENSRDTKAARAGRAPESNRGTEATRAGRAAARHSPSNSRDAAATRTRSTTARANPHSPSPPSPHPPSPPSPHLLSSPRAPSPPGLHLLSSPHPPSSPGPHLLSPPHSPSPPGSGSNRRTAAAHTGKVSNRNGPKSNRDAATTHTGRAAAKISPENNRDATAAYTVSATAKISFDNDQNAPATARTGTESKRHAAATRTGKTATKIDSERNRKEVTARTRAAARHGPENNQDAAAVNTRREAVRNSPESNRDAAAAHTERAAIKINLENNQDTAETEREAVKADTNTGSKGAEHKRKVKRKAKDDAATADKDEPKTTGTTKPTTTTGKMRQHSDSKSKHVTTGSDNEAKQDLVCPQCGQNAEKNGYWWQGNVTHMRARCTTCGKRFTWKTIIAHPSSRKHPPRRINTQRPAPGHTQIRPHNHAVTQPPSKSPNHQSHHLKERSPSNTRSQSPRRPATKPAQQEHETITGAMIDDLLRAGAAKASTGSGPQKMLNKFREEKARKARILQQRLDNIRKEWREQERKARANETSNKTPKEDKDTSNHLQEKLNKIRDKSHKQKPQSHTEIDSDTYDDVTRIAAQEQTQYDEDDEYQVLSSESEDEGKTHNHSTKSANAPNDKGNTAKILTSTIAEESASNKAIAKAPRSNAATPTDSNEVTTVRSKAIAKAPKGNTATPTASNKAIAKAPRGNTATPAASSKAIAKAPRGNTATPDTLQSDGDADTTPDLMTPSSELTGDVDETEMPVDKDNNTQEHQDDIDITQLFFDKPKESNNKKRKSKNRKRTKKSKKPRTTRTTKGKKSSQDAYKPIRTRTGLRKRVKATRTMGRRKTKPTWTKACKRPKRITIRKSQVPNAGDGVYIEEDAKKGEFVARFSGEAISKDENDKRTSRYRLKIHNKLYLDAEKEMFFEGRSINDARGTKFKANVRVASGYRVNTCPVTGQKWVKIIATRDIKAGEELFMDYGEAYWKVYGTKTTEAPDQDKPDERQDRVGGSTNEYDKNKRNQLSYSSKTQENTHKQSQSTKDVQDTEASTQLPESEGPEIEEDTETKTTEENEDTDNGTHNENDESDVQNEDEDIWQEYLKLASLPEPPSRIPSQHVKEFVAAAERSAIKFMQTKSTKALFDIVRLVKTVFDPYTTRRKTGIIRQALKDYPNVDLPDPDAKGRRRKRRVTKTKTPAEEQKETIQRAEKLFSDGYIKKAMRTVTTTTRPAAMTKEVVDKLKALHPQQDISQMTKTPYKRRPSKPDEDDILKSVSKANVEASGGPSGWNLKHLRVAMRSKGFTDFMTTYAGMMTEGTAPGRRIILARKGIGLKDKMKPGKIRPIDMCEVFFKILGDACLRKNREAGDLLPTQLGTHTPGGVEPLIYLERLHLQGQAPWTANGVVEVDRSNAYNTMKLTQVQKMLHEHNPKNGPLFEWAYGQEAHVLLKDKDGRRMVVPTSCLCQGGPLACYMYQMGDREDIERLQENLGDRGMAWTFVDDVKILKTTTPTEDEEEPVIMTAVESIHGGKINTDKTRTISNAEAQQEGYATLGGFIGPPEKRAEFVKAEVNKLRDKIQAISPLRKQTQLVLLKQCIIPSLNHVMRNVNPEGCQVLYRDAKAFIATKVAQLAETPVRLGARDLRAGYMPIRDGGRVRDTDLISLPLRYGGLGMGDPIVQSNKAWEACQKKCKFLVDKWMGKTVGPPPDPQKKLMEEYWKKASNQLMNRLTMDKCLKVATNAEKSASSWLNTIPHLPELRLSDKEVASGLRYRLLKRNSGLDLNKRKILHQRVLQEFKSAEYESKLVTMNTQHTQTEDPKGISDSIVQPMAISIMNFNLTLVTRKDAPEPPENTTNWVAYYQKKLHKKALWMQKKRFRRKHFTGYVHFPLTITPSGALLGKSVDWIQQLKRSARLNKKPSPITQLISASALQAMT